MGIELYYLPNTQGNEDNESFGWKLGVESFPGSFYTWLAFMIHIERKYLPSLPESSPLENATPCYHSRLSTGHLFDNQEDNYFLKELWDLQFSSLLTSAERLTLLSMMDCAFFRLEDSQQVFDAWNIVSGEMGKQSMAAFRLLINRCQEMIDKTDDIKDIAVCWSSNNNKFRLYSLFQKHSFDCYKDFFSMEASQHTVNEVIDKPDIKPYETLDTCSHGNTIH